MGNIFQDAIDSEYITSARYYTEPVGIWICLGNGSKRQEIAKHLENTTPCLGKFVDCKQGRAFWSSGSIPGAFGRLCRG